MLIVLCISSIAKALSALAFEQLQAQYMLYYTLPL